jgi:hypothetical protein
MGIYPAGTRVMGTHCHLVAASAPPRKLHFGATGSATVGVLLVKNNYLYLIIKDVRFPWLVRPFALVW